MDWLKAKVKPKRSSSEAPTPPSMRTTTKFKSAASNPALIGHPYARAQPTSTSSSPDITTRSSSGVTGEELVGWVKQILNLTKEILDGMPGQGVVSALAQITSMAEVHL
jgi:hypothetical protein